MTASLVAVVSIERALRLIGIGWKPGRTNGLTSTVTKEFESVDDAMAAGRLLRRSTWNVEKTDKS